MNSYPEGTKDVVCFCMLSLEGLGGHTREDETETHEDKETQEDNQHRLKLYTWGCFKEYQLGYIAEKAQQYPKEVKVKEAQQYPKEVKAKVKGSEEACEDWTCIAFGPGVTYAATRSGSIYTWGYKDHLFRSSLLPKLVSLPSRVLPENTIITQIAVGDEHLLMVDESRKLLIAIGCNKKNQLNLVFPQKIAVANGPIQKLGAQQLGQKDGDRGDIEVQVRSYTAIRRFGTICCGPYHSAVTAEEVISIFTDGVTPFILYPIYRTTPPVEKIGENPNIEASSTTRQASKYPPQPQRSDGGKVCTLEDGTLFFKRDFQLMKWNPNAETANTCHIILDQVDTTTTKTGFKKGSYVYDFWVVQDFVFCTLRSDPPYAIKSEAENQQILFAAVWGRENPLDNNRRRVSPFRKIISSRDFNCNIDIQKVSTRVRSCRRSRSFYTKFLTTP